MQDEINEKTIALYIKTGKLTAQTLQKAMKKLLEQMKKQKGKAPQGKQPLKQLMKQNTGISNIEITEGNIKAFESTAKKYGIDFALKKDTTESPPRYLVFFKAKSIPYFFAVLSKALILSFVISMLETPAFCFISCFRVCLPCGIFCLSCCFFICASRAFIAFWSCCAVSFPVLM